MRTRNLAFVIIGALTLTGIGLGLRGSLAPERLVTGKFLSPGGDHVEVGSYPLNSVLSPDGQFAIVNTNGHRQQLSVVRMTSGELVSKVDFGGRGSRGMYYGLAFGARNTLYVSRGAEDLISVYTLGSDGTLTPVKDIANPAPAGPNRMPHTIAGLAVSGNMLLAVNNQTHMGNGLKGSLSVIDLTTDQVTKRIELGGFPYDVAASPDGKKAYVTSERDGVVHVVDLATGTLAKDIRVGENATCLRWTPDGTRLLASASNSDTISVIDPVRDRVTRTILVRPGALRGLPGSTPLGLAVSADSKTAYVALADLNAVGIIDLQKGAVQGYFSTGWYPTSVTLAGDRVLVTNAKGQAARNPNGKPVGTRGQYILNIIEGTVSLHDVSKLQSNLVANTQEVLTNNLANADQQRTMDRAWTRPPIEHVIYIVKENRTYDQVLGDLPRGNNDPSLVLFGREVTPNQHALAERFVQLDNFYVCAEVSADGWNWSTQGNANEYVARNSVTNYAGRGRTYDFEGTNNGVAVDRRGLKDVAQAGGGYIWDAFAKRGISMRNYGFFMSFDAGSDDKRETEFEPGNTPTKKILMNATCPDFRRYDTSYPDGDAFLKHGVAPAPRQLMKSGRFDDPARILAWEREFNEYVKKGTLPKFMMIRFGRDHTAGTSAGQSSPRAMVAENDYATARVIEALSKSPYWTKSAVFVLEDDAQNGFDHVDSHRSIAFVASPYVKPNLLDSRFYNTDSVLRTMAALLGVKPWNQNVAAAPLMDVFAKTVVNPGVFDAVLPAKEIIGEVNTPRAYRSGDSDVLFNRYEEESLPDMELNDILWGSIKGAKTPRPQTPGAIWRTK